MSHHQGVQVERDSGSAPRPIEPATLRQVLLERLAAAGALFEEDELSYLALTQKVELHFRDRLAWDLHKLLAPRGIIVAREWARADLAILVQDVPLALIELKALYAFDIHIPRNRAAYLERVRADLAKAAALAPTADRFALTLVTSVNGRVPAQLRHRVVKYSSGVERAAAAFGSGASARDAAIPLWDRQLRVLGAKATHVAIPAGTVWDLNVTIDAWLVGPLAGVMPAEEVHQL